MKYSNTAITQLNRWYKQILIKCAIFNAAVITGGVMMAAPAMADSYTPVETRQVVAAGATVDFDGNSFTGLNSGSVNYGGAIYAGSGGTINVSNSLFKDNSLGDGSLAGYRYGGAIETQGGSAVNLTIDNTIFEGNKANGTYKPRGGAIYSGTNNANSVTKISNSTFTGNESKNTKPSTDAMGSAIYHTVSTLILNNNTFENNSGNSTLFSQSGANVTLNGNTFSKNTSAHEGTFNNQNNSTATFTGENKFLDNIGSGLYNYYANAESIFKNGSNTVFSGNDATKQSTPNGGAIYNDAKVTFEAGSTANFTGNKAVSGGAIYNKAGGTMNLNGAATFADNNDANGANDIYNAGTLNFGNGAGDEISLAGGINGSEGVINKTGDGTLVIANALKNQTVAVNAGELHLTNADLTNSAVTMSSNAVLNTLDDAINSYTQIKLADNQQIKVDANLDEGKIDQFSVADGLEEVNLDITEANLMGDATSANGVLLLDKYVKVNTNSVIYEWDDDSKTHLKTGIVGSGEADGKVNISNGVSLSNLEMAAEETQAAVKESVVYEMGENEDFSTATVENANFIVEGNDQSVNVSGTFGIDDKSVVTINNTTFNGEGEINTAGKLRINDSNINVNLKIASGATLESDPTTYTAEVTNEGTASFDGDTFTSTAQLHNSGTANFTNITFEKDSVIDGNGSTGTLNFNGGTNKIGAGVVDNNINLNNGSSIILTDGSNIDDLALTTDANGGTLDMRNNRIDTLSSTALGSDLNVLMDMNLNTDTSDTLGTITGGHGLNLNALELLALGDASEDIQIATAGTNVALSSDVMDTLHTYYSTVSYDAGTGILSLSGKNQYASADLVGSWGTGNYIKAYSAADAANTSVGANLGYLDTQVKVNEDDISDVQTVLGSAQTTAATTGLLSGVTIGADADVVTALDTVAQTAAGTALDNTFTGQNTFANANGITIANGTDPSAADYVETNLRATADGLAIDTGLSVDGALTTTGTATIGNKLTVKAGGADITGNTTIKGGLYVGKTGKEFQVGSTGNVYVGVDKFTVDATDGSMSAAAGKFTVDGNGVVTAQGLKLDGATITGITTSTEMSALLADPTTASDANLVTEKALVSGISTVIAQKEQWAQGLLGVDTTQGTDNQLQNALEKLGTTDGKGNNISATTVAGALHELDVEKAGLAQNNVFTGQNTFANANGITIANGTDPSAADYAKTNLRATADGLAIDTGLSVDGALTTTGNALIGGALGVNGDTTLNGQLVVANQKATVLTGTLGVDGDTTLNGQLVVANQKATVLTGTLGVDGDTTLNNTLTVKGVTVLSDTNGMQFGAGQNVNAIDATEAGLTDKSATTLATVTTVLSSAQNADFTPAATSLAETRIGAAINELNGNMHDVLGDMYSTVDGSYDLSALNGNGFVTAGTVDNLTKDLNAYASNIATAFGGSFDDTTGVWSSGVTAKTSANYTGSVASTTVAGAMDTLAQVTYNIGTATNATYGNIASDNTVNANLDALDAAIGDRSFATTTYVAPNDDLSTAVTKLDKELHTVNHDVRKLRHDMDRGLASVAALSALVPNARGTGNTSLSVGTGYYNGHSAFALGGAHWFTDNLMVNIGAAASMGHTRDMTYRAGVSYSF